MPPFEEYCEEIKSIWDTRWLSNFGPKYQKFKKGLLDYFNVPNIHMFTNGHQALEIAIAALGLKGEVITTPFTFASTTLAIVRSGLTPVFCDISEDDYTMDTDKIESLITERTSAIIPVHVYGNVCNYKEIERIARKHGLKVIYDGAHSFGETIDGKTTAQLGDITMFSFHATKVFHSIEGGCLTYSDDQLAAPLHALGQFGLSKNEDIALPGTNAKMNEFQAAMGVCNLKYVEEYIAARKKCVERYRENLGNIDGIKLCEEKSNIKYNYSYFPVVFDREKLGVDRDDVFKALADNNIFARKYFYPLTSDMTFVRNVTSPAETPVAKKIASNVLTLPLYSELALEDIDEICRIITDMCSH